MAKPRRVILPPIWLVIGISLIFACNEYAPGLRYTSTSAQLLGGAIMLLGLTLLVFAGGLFKRAGTGLIPFTPVTMLVTQGVYQWSRNPMYLGMAMVLLGCAITVGALTALLVPPGFIAVINWRYILPEEQLLSAQFGEDYDAYRARVRRWL